MRTHSTSHRKGFTLIEMMIVVVIATTIMISALKGLEIILRNRALEGEARTLDVIANEIERSFMIQDFNINISSLPGYATYMGGTDTATVTSFGGSTSVDDNYNSFSVSTMHWAVKLARMKGDPISDTLGVVTLGRTANAQIRSAAINQFDNSRILVAGPTNEAESQRYLLISVVASPEKGLIIPSAPTSSSEYLLWFNALWNQVWSTDHSPPSDWTARLSVGDIAKWASNGTGGSNCDRVVAKHITQRKHDLTLNNNVLNTDVQIRVGGASAPILLSSATGTSSAPEKVLYGRWVIAETRTTGSGAVFALNQSQIITAPVVFTLQN